MNLYLMLALSSFGLIALKSFQQLNVVHHEMWWVPPTSYGLAFFEVTLIVNVAPAEGAFPFVVAAVGTGAWAGCFFSMRLHKYLRFSKEV